MQKRLKITPGFQNSGCGSWDDLGRVLSTGAVGGVLREQLGWGPRRGQLRVGRGWWDSDSH